jgi:hypothetical protein
MNDLIQKLNMIARGVRAAGSGDYADTILEASKEIERQRKEIDRLQAKLYTTHAGRELLMLAHLGVTGQTYDQLVEEMKSSGNWVEYDED